MKKQKYYICMIDLIDGIWQYVRSIKPEYKNIHSLHQLYEKRINTEFNFNYDLSYEQFKKQVYIELTGKRYSKMQKDWFINLIKNIPNLVYYKINTIDSATIIVKDFVGMQQYFVDKNVHVRIYLVKRKIENVIDYACYVL